MEFRQMLVFLYAGIILFAGGCIYPINVKPPVYMPEHIYEPNAKIDITGTVTDTEGNVLQDVTLDLLFSNVWATHSEDLVERMTVTGDFAVKKSNYIGVRMEFYKEGYHSEILVFLKPYPSADNAPIIQTDLKVKLRETGTLADVIRSHENLEYNINESRISVCDLTQTAKKKVKFYSSSFGRQIPFEKYLYLDFARNPQGEIIYETERSRAPLGVTAPETYLLKFVSPDPGDGFILIDEQIKNMSYLTDAPDTAYLSKELVLPYKDKRDRYFYIKCGNVYGKGRVSTTAWNNDYWASVEILFNKTPGDRNLRTTEN